jgi:hypothetical protein
VLLWPLVLIAVLTTQVPSDVLVDPRAMVMLAALSWPGLALLGAGLAPTALGTRADAFVAGIALGIGAPVAAITSTLIGVGIVLAIYISGDFTGASRTPSDVTGPALGLTIQLGVLGALRVAPLVAIAVTAWIVLVRARRIRLLD